MTCNIWWACVSSKGYTFSYYPAIGFLLCQSQINRASKSLSPPPTAPVFAPISPTHISADIPHEAQSPSSSPPTQPCLSSPHMVSESLHHLPELLAPAEPSSHDNSPAPLSGSSAPLSNSTQPHRMITCSITRSLKPKPFPNFQLYHSTKHPLQALHTILLPLKPTTYLQA